MSHEIRTPLNGVLGMAQIMAAGELSADQRRRLDTITASGQSLLSVINAILDISKIEAGRMELFLETFDVAGMLGDVAGTVAPLMDRNGNLLKMEMGEGLGGIHADLRQASARGIRNAGDWVGYGIGGLSVGEAKPDIYAMLDVVDLELPEDRPRYLMGVGFPEDLVEGVARGVDLFDCVAPTRMGRTGAFFTTTGRRSIKNAQWRSDPSTLDENCGCVACARFSKAYIRHLFIAEEILGLRLLSLHNVHFLVALMRDARAAIQDGSFAGWSRDWLARYHSRTTSS